MKSAYTVRFYALERSDDQSKLKPLYCRITFQRKKSEFNTGKIADPAKFDPSIPGVKGDHALNSFLLAIKKKIDDVHSQLFQAGEPITAARLKALYLGVSNGDKQAQTHRILKTTSLVEYFKSDIEEKAKLKSEYSKGTIQIYTTTLDFLGEFLTTQNLKHISLKGFKYEHVEGFSQFLKADKGHSLNTANKYLKKLNAVFNKAVKEELITISPFAHFKFKNVKSDRTFLLIDEIKNLLDLKHLNEKHSHTRDVFLFAVFTGLRYVDVAGLTGENIFKDADDKSWLQVRQQKTSELVRIPIITEAKKILNRYRSQYPSVLPVISNQKTNENLKEIAELAGIRKKITFHVARHTFASTIAPLTKMPIELVQKWLGHNKVQTTMIYKGYTGNELAEYVDSLNGALTSHLSTDIQTEVNLLENIPDLEIRWIRITGKISESDKSYNNYVKWILFSLSGDFLTFEKEAACDETSVEKLGSVTINLDLLDFYFATQPKAFREMEFADSENLQDLRASYENITRFEFEKSKFCDNELIDSQLQMKLHIIKLDLVQIIEKEYGRINSTGDWLTTIHRVKQHLESFIQDQEHQAMIFPRAHCALKLSINHKVINSYLQEILDIITSSVTEYKTYQKLY